MNRETELHFSGIPALHKPRSKMVIPHDLLTSWDAAQLTPIYCDPDILPGDTVKMNMASVIRMATPLYPIFGNIVADICFFFVPYRLVWEHWREFWGESKSSWYQQQEYLVPELETDTNNQFQAKSLGDYLGCPVGVSGIHVNQLPFRAYVKIWNDWWKSEALQQDAPLSTSDSDYTVSSGTTYRGGALLNAGKLVDYFSSALPSPQAGPDTVLPLGTVAPVYTRTQEIDTSVYTSIPPALAWRPNNSSFAGFDSSKRYVHYLAGQNGTGNETKAISGVNLNTATTDSNSTSLYPSNLWADLGNATAASINSIRTAFAIQKFYEARANGTRYIEFIKNIFGVTSPDARLQRSEYLGGVRVPVNIQTVLQTSSTDNTSPQGNTGAYSHTAHSGEIFTHSFTEHGCLIGLICCRYYHSYNQGIPKGFTRRKWTDFYIPQFATLGNQPIFNKELYADGSSADNEVFGYQEAWAGGYRYHPNTVTGAMRTTYAQTLDSWHLADNYNAKPVLGSSWIQEDATNINRTLAVSNTVENQFFGDFYFRPVYTRVMPLYSVPGLLDHF